MLCVLEKKKLFMTFVKDYKADFIQGQLLQQGFCSKVER